MLVLGINAASHNTSAALLADGELVAVSHWNKFLKGGLVRFLLANPHAGPEDLAAWDHPSGYRLDPSLTEAHDGVTVMAMVQETQG